jgi:predicted HTH domain antitoxin
MCVAPFELVKAMQRFRKAGLIGEGGHYLETASTIFGMDFLSALEKELNQAFGAIAPIPLEDALKDLEEAIEPLTKEKIEILLERLSSAIPREERRVSFQQAARILAFEFASDKSCLAKENIKEGKRDKENVEQITISAAIS